MMKTDEEKEAQLESIKMIRDWFGNTIQKSVNNKGCIVWDCEEHADIVIQAFDLNWGRNLKVPTWEKNRRAMNYNGLELFRVCYHHKDRIKEVCEERL